MQYIDQSLGYSGSMYHGKLRNRHKKNNADFDMRKFLNKQAKKENTLKKYMSVPERLGLKDVGDRLIKGRPKDFSDTYTLFSRLILPDDYSNKGHRLLSMFIHRVKDDIRKYSGFTPVPVMGITENPDLIPFSLLFGFIMKGNGENLPYATDFLTSYCKKYFPSEFDTAKRISGTSTGEYMGMALRDEGERFIKNLEKTLRVLFMRETCFYTEAPDEIYEFLYYPYYDYVDVNCPSNGDWQLSIIVGKLLNYILPEPVFFSGFGEAYSPAPSGIQITSAKIKEKKDTDTVDSSIKELKENLQIKQEKILRQASYIEKLEKEKKELEKELLCGRKKEARTEENKESSEEDAPQAEEYVQDEGIQYPEETVKALGGKKIVLIGGFNSWTGNLKRTFPKWKYIDPGNNTGKPGPVIKNALGLFIFSKFISHKTTNRFKQSAIDKGVPITYVNNTNLDILLKTVTDSLESWYGKEQERK